MNVLAVGAHPMDILFLSGGTLARYHPAGHSISIVTMCSRPSENPDLPADDLVRARQQETLRAAALIGAQVHFLRLGVCGAWPDRDTRFPLAEIIGQVQPTVILTHDPADYCPDHECTSDLVRECDSVARQQGVITQSPPIRETPEIVFMDTVSGLGFEPEEFVDITPVFDTKRRMMACYEEEIAAWQDHPVVAWMDWVEVHSRYRGMQSGVRYAEAFRRPRKWGLMRPRRILP